MHDGMMYLMLLWLVSEVFKEFWVLECPVASRSLSSLSTFTIAGKL
jgi:hypothetical protein